MKSILKYSVLIFVVVGVYLLLTLSNSSRNSEEVELNDSTVSDNPVASDTMIKHFVGIETTEFESDLVRFTHPTDWSPSLDGDVVSLGIPLEGVLNNTLVFKSGDVEQIKELSELGPDLLAKGFLTLKTSRDTFVREIFDVGTNVSTLEFITQGREEGEVLVMAVEFDRTELPTNDYDSVLFDVFGTMKF